MTITAGHSTVFSLSADGTNFVNAAGLHELTLNNEINLLDSTAFTDAQYKARIGGQKDWKLDVSGYFVVDATSQGLIRSRAPGNTIWFKAMLDGTNGYGLTLGGTPGGSLIQNWSAKSSVAGTVDFSATIVCNGAGLEDVGTPD